MQLWHYAGLLLSIFLSVYISAERIEDDHWNNGQQLEFGRRNKELEELRASLRSYADNSIDTSSMADKIRKLLKHRDKREEKLGNFKSEWTNPCKESFKSRTMSDDTYYNTLNQILKKNLEETNEGVTVDKILDNNVKDIKSVPNETILTKHESKIMNGDTTGFINILFSIVKKDHRFNDNLKLNENSAKDVPNIIENHKGKDIPPDATLNNINPNKNSTQSVDEMKSNENDKSTNVMLQKLLKNPDVQNLVVKVLERMLSKIDRDLEINDVVLLKPLLLPYSNPNINIKLTTVMSNENKIAMPETLHNLVETKVEEKENNTNESIPVPPKQNEAGMDTINITFSINKDELLTELQTNLIENNDSNTKSPQKSDKTVSEKKNIYEHSNLRIDSEIKPSVSYEETTNGMIKEATANISTLKLGLSNGDVDKRNVSRDISKESNSRSENLEANIRSDTAAALTNNGHDFETNTNSEYDNITHVLSISNDSEKFIMIPVDSHIYKIYTAGPIRVLKENGDLYLPLSEQIPNSDDVYRVYNKLREILLEIINNDNLISTREESEGAALRNDTVQVRSKDKDETTNAAEETLTAPGHAMSKRGVKELTELDESFTKDKENSSTDYGSLGELFRYLGGYIEKGLRSSELQFEAEDISKTTGNEVINQSDDSGKIKEDSEKSEENPNKLSSDEEFGREIEDIF